MKAGNRWWSALRARIQDSLTLRSRFMAVSHGFERQQAWIRELEDEVDRLKGELARAREAATGPAMCAAELGRLGLVAEACGRMAESVGKMLAYGRDSQPPSGGRPPRVQLEMAVGYLQAATETMFEAGDVRGGDVASYRREKQARIRGMANAK